MDSTTTIGDAITLLEREIEDRRRALSVLKAMVGLSPSQLPLTGTNKPANGSASRKAVTVGGAAVEILQAAGRPLHAMRELLPLIQERGIKVSKTTLPTALSRQKALKKVEAGVWTYVSKVTAD